MRMSQDPFWLKANIFLTHTGDSGDSILLGKITSGGKVKAIMSFSSVESFVQFADRMKQASLSLNESEDNSESESMSMSPELHADIDQFLSGVSALDDIGES